MSINDRLIISRSLHGILVTRLQIPFNRVRK